MRHLRFLLSVFVTALFALSLAFVAHGHRMPLVDNLAAYAMPDGTLPEFCLDGTSGDTGNHAEHPPCPACTLVQVMALADGPAMAAPMLHARPAVLGPTESGIAFGHTPRAPPARAPPAPILT